MLQNAYPYYLANEPVATNADLVVTDKYTGEEATRVALADAAAIDRAIAAAVDAVEPLRAMPSYRRQEILEHCVTRFRERADELAMTLCIEAGKPIKDARGEVARLIDTFRIAAEESVRKLGRSLLADHAPESPLPIAKFAVAGRPSSVGSDGKTRKVTLVFVTPSLFESHTKVPYTPEGLQPNRSAVVPGPAVARRQRSLPSSRYSAMIETSLDSSS